MRRDVCICYYTLDEGARLPEKKHPDDAGYDIYSNEDITITPGGRYAVGTGVYIEPESDWYVQVVPRSGLAFKNGVTVLNTPGTIDSGYRGEIKVILVNHGEEIFEVHRGDRIAQLIFTPSYEAAFTSTSALSDTDRGQGGFGSTGK